MLFTFCLIFSKIFGPFSDYSYIILKIINSFIHLLMKMAREKFI